MSRRILAFATVALWGVAAAGSGAAAHGPVGTMVVELAEGARPDEAVVGVRLLYSDDDDPAPGATVVATPSGPDGTQVEPVVLADGGTGTYEGTVVLPAPGAWTISVVAEEPAAEATTTYTVPDPAPEPSPTTEPVPAPEEEPTGDEGAAPAADGDDASGAPSDDADADESSVAPGAILAAVVVVGFLALLGVTLWRRRLAAHADPDGPADRRD